MEFLTKHKRALFITAIIICAIIMVLTGVYRTRPTVFEDLLGYVVTPAQKFTTNAGEWVSGKISFLANLYEIEKENRQLRETLDAYQTENARLKLIEQENAKLSELLLLKQKYPEFETVGAEIIAKDPGNWYANFTIDKGRRDGVDKDMVVIAPGGLVGRVMESGANYSKVKAMVDDTSSVSAISTRTGDTGVVKGDMKLMNEGLCRMELIDIDAEIIVGDEIITSNLGDIYPPGISLGIVKEVGADAGGLTKYALIEPMVDFKHLTTVLVICSRYYREYED